MTRLVEKLGDVRYVYTWQGERIFKIVSFYLFRYRSGRLGALDEEHSHEVAETRWLPLGRRPSCCRIAGSARWPAGLSRWFSRSRTSMIRRARRMRRLELRAAAVRAQLLLPDRRRPAAQPAQDGDDPARRQVVEVQEGDDRAGARGQRFGPRELIFDAVIDKVEVKRLGDLSPREIQHDNPELRRTEEMAEFLGQIYNRTCPSRTRSRSSTSPRSSRSRSAPDRASERRSARAAARRSPRTRRRTSRRCARRRRRTLPTIAVPHVGQSAAGSSPPSKKRCAWPQPGQKATQSPSVWRRSSRSQSDAFPRLGMYRPGHDDHRAGG